MDRTTESADLVLLANDAMRARHRPWMILLMWAWEAVWAFAIAWPIGRMAARAYGTHPDGDGVLFRAGALELADFLMHGQRALPAVVGHMTVLVPAALVLGLLPLAALMASMMHATRDRRAPRLRQLWPHVLGSFTPMAGLLVLSAIAIVTSAAAVMALGTAVAGTYAEGHHVGGEPRADMLGLGVTAVGLLVPCFVGILHDMARAAVVRFRAKTGRAIVLAWKAMALHPVGECWSYVWRALVSWGLVALGALVAARLGGRPGVALVALFVVHQAIVLSRVALRASWLARALRSLDSAHSFSARREGPVTWPPPPPPEKETDIPVHSDEPAVPILDQGA
ncbi:hypothetical protein LZC95_16750 [Pendulispora brunnea]|uniref:Uncharacterized protein n=1 Tax=Pendulispora brunnea TaxID=2905690 RepID=A0ABZ2KII6_9BACT